MRKPGRMMALAGAAVVALCATAADAGNAADPAVVAAGREMFQTNCAVCHRASGAGGIHFGAAVSADLRAPGLERTYRGSDALILRAILQAKDQDGNRLDQPMPAWQGRLTPSQARAIIAYLHTLHA